MGTTLRLLQDRERALSRLFVARAVLVSVYAYGVAWEAVTLSHDLGTDNGGTAPTMRTFAGISFTSLAALSVIAASNTSDSRERVRIARNLLLRGLAGVSARLCDRLSSSRFLRSGATATLPFVDQLRTDVVTSPSVLQWIFGLLLAAGAVASIAPGYENAAVSTIGAAAAIASYAVLGRPAREEVHFRESIKLATDATAALAEGAQFGKKNG